MNGQHLACEVLTRMCVILTRSELLFIYKMVQEIISIRRADSGYPHNFIVDFWVFKDDESKSEAKTNSRPRVSAVIQINFCICTKRADNIMYFMVLKMHVKT